MPPPSPIPPIRCVILVEGVAERILVEAFAAAVGATAQGVTVVSAEGDFAMALDRLERDNPSALPLVLAARNGEARSRLTGLLRRLDNDAAYERLDTEALIALARPYGYVVAAALEVELFRGDLGEAIRQILDAGLGLEPKAAAELRTWAEDPEMLQDERLAALVDRFGRERFARALAPRLDAATCPDPVREVLEHARDALV